MTDQPVTVLLKIRDCGHDEFWLRDIIYDNPSILGLGDLQAVMKARGRRARSASPVSMAKRESSR
jgi:hypothetical protein